MLRRHEVCGVVGTYVAQRERRSRCEIGRKGGGIVSPRHICKHDRARFHGVQRLGKLPPVELWHCPACKSTVSAESLGKRRKPAAA